MLVEPDFITVLEPTVIESEGSTESTRLDTQNGKRHCCDFLF